MERFPVINRDFCSGCGKCVEECPFGKVQLNDFVAEIPDILQCGKCEECSVTCERGAVIFVVIN